MDNTTPQLQADRLADPPAPLQGGAGETRQPFTYSTDTHLSQQLWDGPILKEMSCGESS